MSRLVGTVALSVVALTPLALQRAWAAQDGTRRTVPSTRRPVWQLAFAWLLLAAGAIAYPATLLAENGARFPKDSDCIRAPSPGQAVLVVFGHPSSYADAMRLKTRALTIGANPVQVAQDGCGRVRVSVAASSLAAAAAIVGRARAAGLAPSLEASPPA